MVNWSAQQCVISGGYILKDVKMKMKWDIEMEETQIIPNIKLNFYLFYSI